MLKSDGIFFLVSKYPDARENNYFSTIAPYHCKKKKYIDYRRCPTHYFNGETKAVAQEHY